MLNKNHQIFVDEYLQNGSNGLQAYKKAYPNANDDTARVNASKLLQRTDVNEFVTSIKDNVTKELEKCLSISKEIILQDLIDIKNNNKSYRPVVALKAIETINKMQGYNAVEKSEVKHDGGLSVQYDMSKLDTNTLKNLLNAATTDKSS